MSIGTNYKDSTETKTYFYCENFDLFDYKNTEKPLSNLLRTLYARIFNNDSWRFSNFSQRRFLQKTFLDKNLIPLL